MFDSEYEAKRLLRIAENKRKLVSLNIATFERPAPPASAPKAKKQNKTATKQTKPTRVSKRVKTLRTQQSKADAVAKEAHDFLQHWATIVKQLRWKNRHTQKLEAPTYTWAQFKKLKEEREQELDKLLEEQPPSLDLPFVYPCQVQSWRRGSQERTNDLNLQFEPFHSLCLGRQVLPEGRHSVMHALCPSNAVNFARTNRICLWKNAMVLFDSDEDSEYAFHEDTVDGRRVVYFEWLAQLRKNSLPMIVQRLSKVQKGDECLRLNKSYYGTSGDENESTKEPLLFFLEHPAGVHIYCGRLGYLGHRGSNPPEFRWQLLDVAAMDWNKIFRALDLEY
ncbi:hypothetical protein PHYSODRAFT_332155 [Phytophthora sojae]|uniref:Uncharacterized protein n=1 Tax=Phytophthora sojae (strain P6497) TaxID=1094619 RepID=G4ZCX6_PHYSP|nr:hypothetical protein PHYSODRAFT_332155 [Phytophthora sojae]EGZ18334.1 hypothetical protein PHYSODRAFT_332155 [Phytophthora sojae]|eukprot:XP_009527392.1 hypothetical protein PHYSODRAFT_332155 [Phytophthora sojae]